MPLLEGVRVVRGPDWIWGDQDGGEGNVGTIIDTSYSRTKPRTATVIWDSGVIGEYRGGPKGRYDLRMVSNATTPLYFGSPRGQHPGIRCDEGYKNLAVGCLSKDIRGIRWQCSTCNANLCPGCFLQENPHRHGDNQSFQRYDDKDVKEPVTVSIWGTSGSQSRIPLIGMFPGAKVCEDPDWLYGRENERKIGIVISESSMDLSANEVLIEWQTSKKQKSRLKRCDSKKLAFRLLEPAIGGYYFPPAYPPLLVPIPDTDSEPSRPRPFPAFTPEDRVQIDPEIEVEELQKKQINHGGFKKGMEKYIGQVGIVHSLIGSDVYVKYRDVCSNWRVNSDVITKINKFSIGQIIRIRMDEQTIREIDEDFGRFRTEDHEKFEGATGRVINIDAQDPDKLYIHFDNDAIYKWLCKDNPLPSRWMESLRKGDLWIDNSLLDLAEKMTKLFFSAVDQGDVRVPKVLFERHGVDPESRNSAGLSALHVACQKGHLDVIKWLSDEAQVELEQQSSEGLRAIHYAVNNCRPEVLKLLIERGVQLDSRITTNTKKTALHFAVSNQFTECLELLIQHGCNVNSQDSEGDTLLHTSILNGRTPNVIRMLISCGRIDFKLKNKKGFNVLHSAVVKEDIKAVELILQNADYKDLYSDLMPDSQSTVLHYVCARQNFKIAKLLVPVGSVKILDAKNEDGMTALLVACQKKDYALIELLSEAGADATIFDGSGNTAIVLVASNSAENDEIVTPLNYPAIFKFCQSVGERSCREMMRNYPILGLIGFLIHKGCRWTNKEKEILLEKGVPKSFLKILDQFAASRRNPSSAGSVPCMGLKGACALRAEFQLSCPHRAIYRACSKCFLLNVEKAKCGCADENIKSIPTDPFKIEPVPIGDQEDLLDYEFRWIRNEFFENRGLFQDRFGNEYEHAGSWKDGRQGYRCKIAKCPAMARKSVSNDGSYYIDLVNTHNHPLVPTDSFTNPGQSAAKRQRVA